MKRQTFTLIELLVVIAIIAILAAILIPLIGNAMENSRRTTCLNNYKTIGTAVVNYRADNKGQMPVAATNDQVPHNPRGNSKYYSVNKDQGHIIGVLDYGYIKSFKLTSGPDANGYYTVSSDTKKNGDVWLCPSIQKELHKATHGTDAKTRAGFFLANASRSIDSRTMYNFKFFSEDVKKPYNTSTKLPVSYELCPMMAEMCANSCMTGASGDPQKGYRKGEYIPAPHAESYIVSWMDGHAEVCQAEKTKDSAQKRFLNWQPINDNDKYYAPFGNRAQN